MSIPRIVNAMEYIDDDLVSYETSKEIISETEIISKLQKWFISEVNNFINKNKKMEKIRKL